ncbi:hypothetical protein SZN_18581 [Streptomyces zinciresistens K42]|uniref:Gamma-glutamylcyclotransferase AIG2-like domain-containing protein n=1 Tax=Streptomyces zinciresistens K42 TaxID=700597 RepID=G2GDY8_9ACTN|nr:gamma-glutamylcyclotransferase family protein [Streptomyces zinciresistens]EGX58294.1 hypothetical protein SZN_18581 [Streptomyces zinciresistens K42]
MTPSPRLPFFVYGTLRPGEHHHDAFLRGRTLAEEPARVNGAVLYDGPGYPYAVRDGRDGATVHGHLVTARPEEYPALLAALDHLEEYTPGDPRNLYERIAVEVVRASDETAVRAWIYVAAPSVAARLGSRGTRIDSGDWSAGPDAAPR